MVKIGTEHTATILPPVVTILNRTSYTALDASKKETA